MKLHFRFLPFLLILWTVALALPAQVPGVEFKELRIENATCKGVKGIFLAGKLDYDPWKFQGNKLEKEIRVYFRDKKTQRILGELQTDVSAAWQDIAFTHLPPEKEADEIFTFLPVTQVRLGSGSHEIEAWAELYDTFHKTLSLRSETVSKVIEIPKTESFILVHSPFRSEETAPKQRYNRKGEPYLALDLTRIFPAERDLGRVLQLSPESRLGIGLVDPFGKLVSERVSFPGPRPGNWQTYFTNYDWGEIKIDPEPVFETGELEKTLHFDPSGSWAEDLAVDIRLMRPEKYAERYPLLPPGAKFDCHAATTGEEPAKSQKIIWAFAKKPDPGRQLEQQPFLHVFVGDQLAYTSGWCRTDSFFMPWARNFIREHPEQAAFWEPEKIMASKVLQAYPRESANHKEMVIQLPFEELEGLLSNRDTTEVPISIRFSSILSYKNERLFLSTQEKRVCWKPFVEYREARNAALRKKRLIFTGIGMLVAILLAIAGRYLYKNRNRTTHIRIED